MTEASGERRFAAYATALQQLVVKEMSAKESGRSGGGQAGKSDAALSPVLLFSPHPDDESITGLLPLRLLEEEGRRVINVALTLGSSPERRRARAVELAGACDILGFAVEHFVPGCEAPELLKLFGRRGEEEAEALVEPILRILAHYMPALVVYPHHRDRHPAHEGAARLLERALRLFSMQGNTVAAAETECWQPQSRTDLIIEGSAAQVGHLCLAIAAHHGEVIRNPYHVRQPIRMLENGFRASELLAGFGGQAMPAAFCELYGLFLYQGGEKKRSPHRQFRPRSLSLSLDLILAESF